MDRNHENINNVQINCIAQTIMMATAATERVSWIRKDQYLNAYYNRLRSKTNWELHFHFLRVFFLKNFAIDKNCLEKMAGKVAVDHGLLELNYWFLFNFAVLAENVGPQKIWRFFSVPMENTHLSVRSCVFALFYDFMKKIANRITAKIRLR